MSDRMTAADVDERAVRAALAEIKTPTFHTKDLANQAAMLLAHGLWAGERVAGYYPAVGTYLSLHCEELSIRRISPDGLSNATWKKAAGR
jgi:hypothetical protein